MRTKVKGSNGILPLKNSWQAAASLFSFAQSAKGRMGRTQSHGLPSCRHVQRGFGYRFLRARLAVGDAEVKIPSHAPVATAAVVHPIASCFPFNHSFPIHKRCHEFEKRHAVVCSASLRHGGVTKICAWARGRLALARQTAFAQGHPAVGRDDPDFFVGTAPDRRPDRIDRKLGPFTPLLLRRRWISFEAL